MPGDNARRSLVGSDLETIPRGRASRPNARQAEGNGKLFMSISSTPCNSDLQLLSGRFRMQFQRFNSAALMAFAEFLIDESAPLMVHHVAQAQFHFIGDQNRCCGRSDPRG